MLTTAGLSKRSDNVTSVATYFPVVNAPTQVCGKISPKAVTPTQVCGKISPKAVTPTQVCGKVSATA